VKSSVGGRFMIGSLSDDDDEDDDDDDDDELSSSGVA